MSTLGESYQGNNDPFFLLCRLEVGLSISNLDLLMIGMVLDIWTEK